MIEEEDIIFSESPQEILNILLQEGSIDESDQKHYKINYFGEKNESYFKSISDNISEKNKDIEEMKSHLDKIENKKNYYLYIKYKDIYIGGLSIFDCQSKEGFGFYKYLNNPEPSFYLGQWEKNVKSGIGFLKIDNNHFYFGHFKGNQMNDYGLYYNKKNDIFYYGKFNNGIFLEGLYCNLSKDIYYFGKFKDNKKNDDFCCFINYKKNRLFLGEIKNDLFIKGYVIIYDTEESDTSIVLKTEKFIHYDKNNQQSPINTPKINSEITDIIFQIMTNIGNYKQILDSSKEFFLEYEEHFNDYSYNNGIGRYNNFQNKYSFEKELIDEYKHYFDQLNSNQINLEEIKNNLQE